MESQELKCFRCRNANATFICMCQVEPAFLCRDCLEPHRKEKSCVSHPISLSKIRSISEEEQSSSLNDKHFSKKVQIYYELFKRKEAVLESQEKTDSFKKMIEDWINEKKNTYRSILDKIDRCFHDFHEMYISSQTEKFMLQYETFRQSGLRGLEIQDCPSTTSNIQDLQDTIQNAFSCNVQIVGAQDLTANFEELTAAIQEKDGTILDLKSQLENLQHEYSISTEESLRSIKEKDEIIHRLENQLKASQQEVAPRYELFHPYSFTGHSGHIYSVCMSQNGKWAVSASRDRTAKIWDLDNKREEGTLAGHAKTVYAVCMSMDGRYIITGSEDNSIRVWNFHDRSLKETLEGHTGTVYSLCMSLDGAWIISGSGDKSVKIWNFQNSSQVTTLTEHTNYVYSVYHSQNGKWIVSGSSDDTVIVWNFESKAKEFILRGHQGYVFSACMTPDGERIISGGADKTIRIWNFNTRAQEVVLEGHTNAVCSLGITMDGRWILSAGYDGSIRVWNLYKNALETVFSENAGTIYSVAISSDGRRIISGDANKRVQIWSQHL
jgi:WD40 repeat protein